LIQNQSSRATHLYCCSFVKGSTLSGRTTLFLWLCHSHDDRRAVFGSDIKPLHSPGFARNFMRLLRREGGVVFTNGDLDGWAGGSLSGSETDAAHDYYSSPDGDHGPKMEDAKLKQSDSPHDSDGPPGRDGPPSGPGQENWRERVAFITYKGASHCTDTHTYAWQTPGEPAEWKQQRAEAMDRAAAFAMPSRQAALRDMPPLKQDPLAQLVEKPAV
jgi:hypothetical protein